MADLNLNEEMTFDKTHHIFLTPDKPFNFRFTKIRTEWFKLKRNGLAKYFRLNLVP
jgi:hypothetical protein